MKRKWIVISAIIVVMLAAGIIVKANSSNTTIDGTIEVEKYIIIEDAPEETDHEFVPYGK